VDIRAVNSLGLFGKLQNLASHHLHVVILESSNCFPVPLYGLDYCHNFMNNRFEVQSIDCRSALFSFGLWVSVLQLNWAYGTTKAAISKFIVNKFAALQLNRSIQCIHRHTSCHAGQHNEYRRADQV